MDLAFVGAIVALAGLAVLLIGLCHRLAQRQGDRS
jgi:hypothetical protein